MAARKHTTKQKAAKPKKAAEPRQPVDWEAIEPLYRAGQLSVREIAAQFGVTHTAINKRAKACGWERPLADRVRKAVREKLARADGFHDGFRNGFQSQRMSDDQVVDNSSNVGVAVVTTHRRDTGNLRNLAALMAAELADLNKHIAEVEADINAALPDDPQRRNRMLQSVSLYRRSGTLANLSQTVARLIPLERQAFNLDDVGSGSEHEKWLNQLAEAGI